MNKTKWPLTTILAGLLYCLSHSVNATMIIDPEAGWTGSIAWVDGLGQIDYINYPNNPNIDNDWSISAAVDSQMSFATVYDAYIPGDEFEFVLDGQALVWDSTYTDNDGFFHGELYDLFLAAGTHLLTINVTAVSYPYGIASAEFSGLTEVIKPGEIVGVSEPAVLPLIGIGLLLLFTLRRKAHLECYV
jgi:hypothetical protein